MRAYLVAIAGWFLVAFAVPAAAQDAARPSVACTTWSLERADCFVIGTEGGMHHVHRNGANWSGFEFLQGSLRSRISCTAQTSTQLDCFALGSDSGLWRRAWQGGHWLTGGFLTGGWQTLGGAGVANSSPSCVTTGETRSDCFIRDRENGLTRITLRNNRRGGTERISGLVLRSDPECVAADDGSFAERTAPALATPIWCFAKGPDNALWMVRVRAEPGGTTPYVWTSLGGAITSDPDCVAYRVFAVRCFARGTDNAMHTQDITTEAGGGWRSVGGALTSQPSCVSFRHERIDCFVRGTDNALHHNAGTIDANRPGSITWAGWESWGGGLASAPTCIVHRPRLSGLTDRFERIDCFVRGTDNALHNIAWFPSGRGDWRRLGGALHARF